MTDGRQKQPTLLALIKTPAPSPHPNQSASPKKPHLANGPIPGWSDSAEQLSHAHAYASPARLVRACVWWQEAKRRNRLTDRLPQNNSRTEPDSTPLRSTEPDMADEGVAQMSISEFEDDYGGGGDEDGAAYCVRSYYYAINWSLLHILHLYILQYTTHTLFICVSFNIPPIMFLYRSI